MSNEIITLENLQEFKSKLDETFVDNDYISLVNTSRGWGSAGGQTLTIGTITKDFVVHRFALSFETNAKPSTANVSYKLYIGSTIVDTGNVYVANGLSGTGGANGVGNASCVLSMKELSTPLSVTSGTQVKLQLSPVSGTTAYCRYCGINIVLR